MITVVDYCLNVQIKLRKLAPTDMEERRAWSGATGRAASAVSYALEGKDSKALRLAGRLAEKYHIVLS